MKERIGDILAWILIDKTGDDDMDSAIARANGDFNDDNTGRQMDADEQRTATMLETGVFAGRKAGNDRLAMYHNGLGQVERKVSEAMMLVRDLYRDDILPEDIVSIDQHLVYDVLKDALHAIDVERADVTRQMARRNRR